jgi:NADH-quinone oxidoreductase subunit E
MPRVLTQKTVSAIDELCSRYPTRLAAMLPALHLVMNEVGHVTQDAAADVAEALDVPLTRVHEAVTFYTMFYDRPLGRHTVKLCRNLACHLRGADRLIEHAKQVLGVDLGDTTDDGRVTLDTDECLASCGTGPMLWCRTRTQAGEVDERIVERLTLDGLERFLRELP